MASKKAPSPIDRHVGARIRMCRVLIGMSQEKLGEQLGVSFQQVQKYEKGTNRVGSGRLHEIGRILGVPVAFFYDGQEGAELAAEVPQGSSSGEEALRQKDGLQLLQAFNAIPDQNARRALVEIARALAEQSAKSEVRLAGTGNTPDEALLYPRRAAEERRYEV